MFPEPIESIIHGEPYPVRNIFINREKQFTPKALSVSLQKDARLPIIPPTIMGIIKSHQMHRVTEENFDIFPLPTWQTLVRDCANKGLLMLADPDDVQKYFTAQLKNFITSVQFTNEYYLLWHARDYENRPGRPRGEWKEQHFQLVQRVEVPGLWDFMTFVAEKFNLPLPPLRPVFRTLAIKSVTSDGQPPYKETVSRPASFAELHRVGARLNASGKIHESTPVIMKMVTKLFLENNEVNWELEN